MNEIAQARFLHCEFITAWPSVSFSVKTHIEHLEDVKVQCQAQAIWLKGVKPIQGWTVKSDEWHIK